jgi:DNA-directed RNA polymerase specialized sigma24 family protein
MKTDVFPNTLNSWIVRKLDEGGPSLAEVNRHVMSVYARPLKVYFLGSSERHLGEPDDIVNGFFESRLSHDDFLSKWRESGMRLRRWLMNALCFYLKEVRRRNRRDAVAGENDDEPVSFTGDPDAEIDRTFVVELVREALRRAGEQCVEEGMGAHWDVFLRHHHHGESYDHIAGEIGVTRARAEVMGRTATRRFRKVIRDLLAADGVPEDELDREIESLLETTS